MTDAEQRHDPVDELIALLDLEQIEVNIFRGVSPKDRSQRVFGGQVLGQALVAASRTVEGRICHSLHAYFLRAGDPKVPILYEVDRSRDGIELHLAARGGDPARPADLSHVGVVPGAGSRGWSIRSICRRCRRRKILPSEDDFRAKIADKIPEQYREHFLRKRPIEIRPVDRTDIFAPQKRPPHQTVWVRATGELPADIALQQCVLAYASDMTLLDTGLAAARHRLVRRTHPDGEPRSCDVVSPPVPRR